MDTARERLTGAMRPIRDTITAPLSTALGNVLASTIRAEFNVPPTDNSAMDGYAFCAKDLEAAGGELPISQRILTGQSPGPLLVGTAARIFTGAGIPQGADTVVMQERCREREGHVLIEGEIHTGDNIRRAGEDIRAGSDILSAGRRLRPQDIGLVASTGIDALPLIRRPRIAILSTGDELVRPGQRLAPGQTYNSNEPLLNGLLQALGCEVLPARHVGDGLDPTIQALADLAVEADLIISSGGVSVGEEDHIKAAVVALGSLDLWKVAVKPGKPLAFGNVGETPILCLPGNPVSLLVTFLLFGAPIIRRLQGRNDLFPAPMTIPAAFTRDRPIKREEYLRVRIENGHLVPYPQQGSGVLSSATWADGLGRVPAETTVAEGDLLDYFDFQQLTE